jgi:hypothetical protein
MEHDVDILLDAFDEAGEVQVSATGGPAIKPGVRITAEVRASLFAAAGDLDRLCREALESHDFDAITRSVEASHAIHRALIAFDDVAPAFGRQTTPTFSPHRVQVDRARPMERPLAAPEPVF